MLSFFLIVMIYLGLEFAKLLVPKVIFSLLLYAIVGSTMPLNHLFVCLFVVIFFLPLFLDPMFSSSCNSSSS